MTQVFINGNGQYGEYTNPICLTGTAGQNAVSYDIKTSTDTINYQDGTMYPRVISVYVAKSDGSRVTNITPSNSSGWQFSYSTNGGDPWNIISSDQIQTEGDNGMLFRATNETIVLSKYVPIVKSGANGATYQLQLSNISLSYTPSDQDYNLQMSCNVTLYENGNSVDDNVANIKMQLNSNDKTDLQYSSDHWAATVNTTVQSNSSVITIYAYNKNGAYLTSMAIPVSASADGSTGQTFKGSPLRIVGAWQEGTKYYDGKRDAGNGIFYQDVVLYENVYYACVNTDSGVKDGWSMTPDVASYFSAFSISPNVVADLVIANKAFIKEISSNELVIFDNDKIVAGMTSSKAVDESSPLNGKVTTEGKGDVRIWAGEISNGDLTTAPFTVTSAGKLKATNADITGTINSKSGNIGGFAISDKSLVSESGSIIKFFNRQTTGTTLKLDINVGNELYAYQETANLCPVLYIEDIKSGNDIYEPAGIAINSRKSNNDQTTAILVQSGYISGLREPVTNIVNNFGSAGIGGPYDYGGTFIVKGDNVHVRLADECLKGTQHTYIMQGTCTISFSSDKSNIYRSNSANPSTEATFSGGSLWIRCLFDGTNWYLCE